MRHIEIYRTYKQNCTIGSAYVIDGTKIRFSFKTLELPWLNNAVGKSCIPPGEYFAIKHQSPKFGETIWLQDVEGRSEILIHPGNFTSEIRGCILPGRRHQDINGDGVPDVTDSRDTMKALLKAVPNRMKIEIH